MDIPGEATTKVAFHAAFVVLSPKVARWGNFSYICIMTETTYRQIVFYKDYFLEFFNEQSEKVKDKNKGSKWQRYISHLLFL